MFFNTIYEKRIHNIYYDKTTEQSSCVEFKRPSGRGIHFSFNNDIDGGIPFWPMGMASDNKVFMLTYGYEIKDYLFQWEILYNNDIIAVCIALPAELHYKFVKEALLNNKDNCISQDFIFEQFNKSQHRGPDNSTMLNLGDNNFIGHIEQSKSIDRSVSQKCTNVPCKRDAKITLFGLNVHDW